MVPVRHHAEGKASIRSKPFKEPLSGEIPFVEQNVYR